MKRSLLNIAIALCISLFAACSQEEIISQANSGEETVSVSAQLPGATPGTRALPDAAAGHQLRCILEVWDQAEGGQLITRIEKLASAAVDGKLQFSFTVPTATNYQCLLWADYVDSDNNAGTPDANGNRQYTDKYYATGSLKAIDFKVTDASLFNNLSSDAFCGKVDKNGTTSQLSVTLKRPFTKVTLKDKSEYITDCTALNVEYNTPSGYNIATGKTTATKAVRASALTPDTSNKTWFSTFIFASADKSTLDEDIKMEITKGGNTEVKKIKGGQISLDENVENNAEANFAAEDDVNIDVDIDGEYPDPNAPKIGYFVNKDGSCSKDFNAETAIGIVFAVGAKGTDTGANYGDDFTGKIIYGYAMALTSVSEVREFLGASGSDNTVLPDISKTGDTPWAIDDYNGYQYTQIILTAYKNFTSVIFEKYNAWLASNIIPSETKSLSNWYIPSGRQVLDMTGLTIGFPGEADITAIVQNETIEAAFNTGNVSVFTKKDPTNMMSSYLFKNSSMAAVQVGYKPDVNANLNCWPTDAVSGEQKPILQKPTAAAKSYFNIRPVLTVFKNVQ